MKKRLAVVLLVVFVLLAAISANAKTVKLEYKYKKGDVAKYKLVSDTNATMGQGMGAMTTKMTADVEEKVLAVNKDGSIKIQVTISNIKMSMPGMEQGKTPQIPNQTTVLTISKTGSIISSNNKGGMSAGLGMPGGSSATMLSQFAYFDIVLPTKAVSIGGTWKKSIPVTSIGGKFDTTSKLEAAALPLGKEVVSKVKQTMKGKADLAKIMKAAMSGGDVPEEYSKQLAQMKGTIDMTGTTVYHFSPSKGKLWKSSSTLDATVNMSMSQAVQKQGAPAKVTMKAKVTTTLTRVN